MSETRTKAKMLIMKKRKLIKQGEHAKAWHVEQELKNLSRKPK